MIYSNKQYHITIDRVSKLKEGLVAATEPDTVTEWARAVEIDALKSQIAELEADLAYYQMLISGEITVAKSHSLESLPMTLVQARIARGLSQSELADALGVKLQQIQRYEASDYMGVSLDRIIKVAKILNVHTVGSFGTEETHGNVIFSWENADTVRWQEFPAKEMVRRRWFDLPRGGDLIEAAKTYFLETAGPHFASALHRKKMRGTYPPNEYSLIAWQARVLDLARMWTEEWNPPAFKLDDRWLSELVALTRRPDGPRAARKLLGRKGIVLVIEEHMPGTYLDGAAMLGARDHPVIGLTLRHNRVDNFWFVLLHELGHIFLHLFEGVRYDFFDDDTTESRDAIELEADEFALNALIPRDQWEGCLSRFALSEEAVQLDAKKLNVAASIVAGRIRREQNNYKILTGLIQSGVRELLQEVDHDPE